METYVVEQARAIDAPYVLGLRRELEDWLEARGVQQWGRGEVTLEDVERQIADGEWRVVRDVHGLVAAFRLLWSDEPIWQHENAYSAYLHGLMVTRGAAGRGIGAALLRWVEDQARAADAPNVRLDCVESNARLRAHYAAQGFREVGRRDFDGRWFSAVLLEKPLRD